MTIRPVHHVALRSLLLVLMASIGSISTCSLAAAPPGLPEDAPATVGMDADRLSAIDAIVNEGMRRGEMPGAVVLVARHGTVVYHRAFGSRQVEPERVPMTVDTVFDLASLTKPVATATSVMKLVEEGRVGLDDAVADHIPEFAENGKGEITVRQLLTHQGGLIADNSLKDYLEGPELAFERIHQLSLRAEPGTRFIYSDVGFIVLGELIEKLTGRTVHEFSRQEVFGPLGMSDTGYLPEPDLPAARGSDGRT